MKVRSKRRIKLYPKIMLMLIPHEYMRIMYLAIAGILMASFAVGFSPSALSGRQLIPTLLMFMVLVVSLVAGMVGKRYVINAIKREVQIVTDICWIPVHTQKFFAFDELDAVNFVAIAMGRSRKSAMLIYTEKGWA